MKCHVSNRNVLMKKLLQLSVMVLFSWMLTACHHQPPKAQYLSWQLKKNHFEESNFKPFYHIDVSYPEVVSNVPQKSTQKINQRIHDLIKKQILTFKQN